MIIVALSHADSTDDFLMKPITAKLFDAGFKTVVFPFDKYTKELFYILTDITIDEVSYPERVVHVRDETDKWKYISGEEDTLNVKEMYERFAGHPFIVQKMFKMFHNQVSDYNHSDTTAIIVPVMDKISKFTELSKYHTFYMFTSTNALESETQLRVSLMNKAGQHGYTRHLSNRTKTGLVTMTKRAIDVWLRTLPKSTAIDLTPPLVQASKFDRALCLTGDGHGKNICRHYNGEGGCLDWLVFNKKSVDDVPPRFKPDWSCYNETSTIEINKALGNNTISAVNYGKY